MKNIFFVRLSLVASFAFTPLLAQAQNSTGLVGVAPSFSNEMISDNFLATSLDPNVHNLIATYGTDSKEFLQATVSPLRNEIYNEVIQEATIQNQHHSGICWTEGTHSKVEMEAINSGKLAKGTTLSRSYIFFYYLLESANKYVDGLIQLRNSSATMKGSDIVAAVVPGIIDGQDARDFVVLADKWGLAPLSAMPQLATIDNDTQLMFDLNQYLQEMGYWLLSYSVTFSQDRLLSKESTDINYAYPTPPLTDAQTAILQSMKKTIMTGVWKMLEQSLGHVPSQFQLAVPDSQHPGALKTVSFTPQSFKNYLGVDPTKWVRVANIFNYPRNKAYNTTDYPSLGGDYVTLSVTQERMAELTEHEILAGRGVVIAINFDDSTSGINETNGDIIPGSLDTMKLYGFTGDQQVPNLNDLELARIGVTATDHVTVITGIDRDLSKPATEPWIKARMQNSWSKHKGYQGNYALYYQSFLRDVSSIYVDPSALTPEEQVELAAPNKDSAPFAGAGDSKHH